jgi:hypothetical protein
MKAWVKNETTEPTEEYSVFSKRIFLKTHDRAAISSAR